MKSMETTKTKVNPIIKEVLLDALAEKVWKAITDTEDMKQWYFDMVNFKPEVGCEFRFYGEKDGKKFLHLCRITEVEVNRKLSYTWMYEDHPVETVVHFELFPKGNKTLLRFTHEGLEKLPQDGDYAIENFVTGWTSLLEKSIIEFLKK